MRRPSVCAELWDIRLAKGGCCRFAQRFLRAERFGERRLQSPSDGVSKLSPLAPASGKSRRDWALRADSKPVEIMRRTSSGVAAPPNFASRCTFASRSERSNVFCGSPLAAGTRPSRCRPSRVVTSTQPPQKFPGALSICGIELHLDAVQKCAHVGIAAKSIP